MTTHQNVRLEYAMRCGNCQTDITAGDPHDVTLVSGGAYLHNHLQCPGEEPPRPLDGEATAIATAVGTLAAAAVGYLFSRLPRNRR